MRGFILILKAEGNQFTTTTKLFPEDKDAVISPDLQLRELEHAARRLLRAYQKRKKAERESDG